jgi:hypothetical protein
MAQRKKASKRQSAKKPPVTDKRFKPQEVVDAIVEWMGSVAKAARALNVERQTIYNYRNEYPEIAAAIETARNSYKETCQELGKDNHLTRLQDGDAAATAYELAKLEPKPISASIDTTKLTKDEVVELWRLLVKAKPDGDPES